MLVSEFNGLVSKRAAVNRRAALILFIAFYIFYAKIVPMNKKRKIAAKKKRKADGKTVSLRHR